MQEEIAARLMEAISDKGIKQSFLARKIGIDRNYLNRKLHGHHPFTIPEFLGLCQLLDVKPETFMREAQN